MSREERRAYQRQMKSMERGPALPPAARARAERNAARRARRRKADAPGSFSRRWLVRTFLIAFLVGFIAFSLQWPEMPWALYVGLAVGAVTAGLLAGFRLLQRRGVPPAS